jgi:acyl-CoA dehydrogenase
MSDQRSMLADVVTRLFTERVTKEAIEAAEKGTWPRELWDAVEENGLTVPLVPEARGGAGMTWGDAHVIVVAAGRHAVPLPVAETIVASALLATAGLDVPGGPLTIAPTHRDETIRLSRDGTAWRATGTAARVPWGADAGHVVVVADVDGRSTVALLATQTARITRDKSLAQEPRDTLVFERTPVVAAAPAERLPLDAVWRHGAMARAAQIAGGLEYALAQSTRYATERKQFGRPIGNFQAIQHNLALLAGHTAAAGMAAANAFRAADRGDAAFEIAVAKARAGEAAGLGAGIAHQVHGAIGFTYEHSLHFVTRRLWSWRAEFGGEGYWQAELGRAAAREGGDALWPMVTAR